MIKKNLTFILSTLFLIYGCVAEKEFPTSSAAGDDALTAKITGSTTANHLEGCLLLYLDEKTAARARNGESEDIIKEMFDGMGVTCLEPALRHEPANKKLARELGLHRWFMISFDEAISTRALAAKIAPRPEICMIQYNNLPELASDCIATPFTPETKSEDIESNIPFNDPMNPYQWNLVNTGDKSIAETAREGADVGVRDAWKLTAGSPDVIVAVCDAPVQYNHPDLADAMWVNELEKNGIKGEDDDQNGYIDDIHGYNFYSHTKYHGQINWRSEGETVHGTHVAGIVGAVNGNGIGVSSVAGGSGNSDGVRIMCCQVYEGKNTGGDRDMAEAIMYAADNGACIAQCSYGYPSYTFSCDEDYIVNAPLEYRAIKYFTNPQNSNHPALTSNIAIFASGNESAATSVHPGALPICISVTGLGPDYLPAFYTNYGVGCNIAAPGGDGCIGALKEEDNRSKILSTSIGDILTEYAWMEGTSMACPHVSGVAALGVSYAGKLGKKFSGEEFTALLLSSVNDINQYLTEGYKTFNDRTINMKTYYKRMGTGAIDAWKLLMQIEGTPSVMVGTGQLCKVDLSEYFGESAKDLTFTKIEYEDDVQQTLGFASKPRIKDGMLEIMCTKSGSAKITISALAGGEEISNGSNIGNAEFSREISIISRGVYSTNGGWF